MLKRHLLQRRSKPLFTVKDGKLLTNNVLIKVRKIRPKTAVELRICGQKCSSLILRPFFGGGKKSKCHEKGCFPDILILRVMSVFVLKIGRI